MSDNETPAGDTRVAGVAPLLGIWLHRGSYLKLKLFCYPGYPALLTAPSTCAAARLTKTSFSSAPSNVVPAVLAVPHVSQSFRW